MRQLRTVALLIGLIVAFAWVRAGASHAGVAELPPRPTTVPTPTPTATPVPSVDAPRAGATILLQAAGMPAEVWTVVQWQDAHGDWHDVEGWQGTLEDGEKRWWVAPVNFRKGPFHWVLYERRGGTLLATSGAFDLPQSPYEIVVVRVE